MSVKHPDFVKWDGKIQRYAVIPLLVDATLFNVILFGHLLGAEVFAIVFLIISATTIFAVLGGIRLWGKGRFRDSWKKDHP